MSICLQFALLRIRGKFSPLIETSAGSTESVYVAKHAGMKPRSNEVCSQIEV